MLVGSRGILVGTYFILVGSALILLGSHVILGVGFDVNRLSMILVNTALILVGFLVQIKKINGELLVGYLN